MPNQDTDTQPTIKTRQSEATTSNQREVIDQPIISFDQPLQSSTPIMQPANSSVTLSTNSDKIEIQRLVGSNWATWKWQLQNVLDARGLTSVLTSDEPRGSPSEVAARQIISSSLDQSLISKVIHCQSAQQIWSCLRGIYENRTSFAKTDLIGRMNSLKMNTLDDVENGVSEIQSLACQIRALDGAVDDATIESAILRALPESFASFILSWTFQDTEKRTLDNLHAHLMRTVCHLRTYNNNSAQDKALASKQIVPNYSRPQIPSGSLDDSDKKLFCRYCKKTNHNIKDCLKLKNKRERESQSSGEVAVKAGQPQEEPKDKSEDDISAARVAYGHVATSGESCCLKSNSVTDHVTALWIADSGASFHMTSHYEWIANYHELSDKILVRMGDGRIVKAHGRGFIETTTGILDPVFYLPEISENLLSLSSCAKNHRIFAKCTDTHMIFTKNDREIFRGILNNYGIYEINFEMKLAKHVTMLSTSLNDWHDRLAHVSPDMIKYMADNKIVNGMNISDEPDPKCEPCAAGKSHRARHPFKTTPRAECPGQILHFDTVGPMPEQSLGNKLYYVLCKDSFSAYRHIFFVNRKSDIGTGVKQIISKVKLETGNDVLKIVSDNGTEYNNRDLRNFLDEKGIIHETSATYTPQQNGYIERDIRTVAEAARSLRLQADLPKPYWAEAMATSVYLLNRVINSRNKEKTPFELWFNRKPSVNNLHKFGELAIVYTKPQFRDKLDPKGTRMIFVGYTEIFNTFRFIEPQTSRLIISCNATFLNRFLSSNSTSPDKEDRNHVIIESSPMSSIHEPLIIENNDDQDSSDYDNAELDQESNRTFVRGSDLVTDISDYQVASDHADRTFSMDIRRESPAEMPTENPDSERIATLRPRDKNHRPNYCPWKINLSAIQSEEDPKSYSEAIARPDKELWLKAMVEELDCLRQCDVWTLVDKPKGKNIVTNRWVLKIKRDPEGRISRYRARLVARGFSQVEGKDYHDTYAPTAAMSVVRLLFAHAAVEDLKMAQFDIKTAFLYGDLEEEVFMHQPEGFVQDSNKICRLKRSLYGLKQSPRQWCRKFTDFLLSLGLQSAVEDRCVFYQRDPQILVVIYVDDGIIFARNQQDIDHVLSEFKRRFNVHTMPLNSFLGFQIKQGPGMIILHQEGYFKQILSKFGFMDAKSERSPISPCRLPDDPTPIDPTIPYREIVGSLLYAAVNTRVDIAYPVSLACRSVSCPTNKDWNGVMRILRYLNGNSDLAIVYRKDRHQDFLTYVDAAFANDENTDRSTTGYIVMFGGAPIAWQSAKQKLVTLSSTEAELVGICTAFKESFWLHNFAVEIGIIKPQTIRILCDNTSSITLATNERSVLRTRHFRARFSFLHEKTRDKIVAIEHISAKHQLADMLTKSTSVQSFMDARNKMMSSHRIKTLFIAMFAALILCPKVGAIHFDTIRPILYQATEKFVDVGVTQYVIDFTYSNPCEILNSFLQPNAPPIQKSALPGENIGTMTQLDINYVNTFINECNQLYHNTWVLKVEELLSRQQAMPIPDIDQGIVVHHMQKRSLGDAFFGVVVYNFISSIFEKLNPWSSYNKVQDIAEHQKLEQERLLKFKHDFNTTLAIQKGMIDLIANNARSIRDQGRQMSQFAKLSSQISWLSSFLQSRILFATADMRTIIDEFTHHRVATLELAELFNISDIANIDPLETEFVSVLRLAPSTLRFTFNIRLTSPDTNVYQVHAFRYWDNLSYIPTMMEYHGSRLVAFNKTSNCLKGLEDTTERGLMVECSTNNYIDPNVQIWRKIVSTNDIYSQDISTVKRTARANYVYCFPYNITIHTQNTRCPTLMFKLPIETSFTTGNISYVPQIKRIKISRKEHLFLEDISLGHFEDNTIAASDVTMFDRIRNLTQMNQDLINEQQRSITIAKHGYTWWLTIIFVITLILITTGLVLWNLRVSRNMHFRSKQVASDVAELKTYDRISCINCIKNTTAQASDSGPKVEAGNDKSIVINVNPSRSLPPTPML